MTTPLLTLESIEKSFGHGQVLRGIDLSVQRGEVISIIGPSGSGKSTLLRCINHLERFDRGRITLDGDEIGSHVARSGRRVELGDRALARQRQRMGIVFQDFNLFPHMTVLENCTFALRRVKGIRAPQAQAKASQALKSVGMSGRENAYPSHLSGGQQQRVAIARAMAMEPELLLFDEPTSALDPELVGEVLTVMRRLALSGATMIIVTHEIKFARDVCDRVVFMDHGVIIESGPPGKVLADPEHPRTRDFLKSIINEPIPQPEASQVVNPAGPDGVGAESGAVAARRPPGQWTPPGRQKERLWTPSPPSPSRATSQFASTPRAVWSARASSRN